MALKGAAIWVCARTSCSDLGASDLGSRNSGSAVSLRFDLEKFRKWECCSLGALAQRAITPVEDEKPHVPGVESTQGNESRGFHKDLNLLPSE
jgi:arogenate/prephenate dehydratase